jgi:hypothetical protein
LADASDLENRLMAATEAQVAAVGIWVDQFAAQMDQLRTRLASALLVLYAGFDGWYDDDLVERIARETVRLLVADIDIVQGLADSYATQVLHQITGEPITIPPTRLPEIRNGADLVGVYRRPAEHYRHLVAVGNPPAEAEAKATRRLERMTNIDLAIAARDAQLAQYGVRQTDGQLGQYRRIVHPELARTGTCGLCIVASDRIYSTAELMPLHPNCHCTTAPVVGDVDPGNSLNNLALQQLYADAGSTAAAELRQTRYQVNDHGEYGPVITRAGDDFKGPGDVKPLEEDVDRARRMLDQTLPVLAEMRARNTPADVLGYQERLVERLQQIAA